MSTTSIKEKESINLAEKAPVLNKIMVGAGWDVNDFDGKEPTDVDLSCFLLDITDNTRKDEDFIFYNNLQSDGGAIQHKGDNRTGAGEGDDEIIFLDLSKIDFDVARIVFVASIYEGAEKKQHFGMVNNAFIRIVNEETREELIRFDLSAAFEGEQAVLFGALERAGNDWYFAADGSAIEGGLAAIAQKYGLLIAGV